jgi:hypothetical protein
VVSVALALMGSAAPVLAQSAEEAAPPRLSLSLNAARTTEAGDCRLTFVTRNMLGADIVALVTEAVLFDPEGRVATLTLFDFGSLPADRPRVRQFDMAGLSCDNLGEVLVNGIDACEGEGLSPAACLDGLRLSSDTDVEVTG